MIIKNMLKMGFAYLYVTLLGTFCRPLLIWLLLRKVKKNESEKRVGNHVDISKTKLLLYYNRKSTWKEVIPVIQHMSILNDRLLIANAFASLYFSNKRLDEAREAIDYVKKESEEWVRLNHKEACKALKLLKQLNSWSLHPHTRGSISGEDALSVMREIREIGGWTVKEWRNSRVAHELLFWSKAHDDESIVSALQSLQIRDDPIIFTHVDFNYEVAEAIGMNEADFDQICLRAENLTCQ